MAADLEPEARRLAEMPIAAGPCGQINRICYPKTPDVLARWVHHHDEGSADHPRDRREIANEVSVASIAADVATWRSV